MISKRELSAKVAEIAGLDRDGAYSEDVGRALFAGAAFETLGYTFKLKDMKPRELTVSEWKAVVTNPAGDVITVEDEEAALALCLALVKAFEAMAGRAQ
ncbi:MAG: hypothetical protein EOM25_09630 [Deltaproteobacteria bacterium]|nr:hypothetical protein [Deltaproteobacteria bacterium]